MLNYKNFLFNRLNFLILFLIFLIPTLLDSYVNSKRFSLYEPDDAEHYILKKTQLKNCFLKECEFNKNAEKYIKNEFLDNERIIKRTVLDYHPVYSVALLLLEKLLFDQYLAFTILNYFSSLLMIYFSFKFYNNYFKESLKKNNILILFFLFFIFLFFTLVEWRDAFKINFGIFIYLLDKLINYPKKNKKFKFYFLNLIQTFIHPAGIICSLAVILIQYLNLINYKFKDFFLFQIKLKYLLYLILTFTLIVFYYFNGIKYVNLDINIANVFDGATQSIFYLNLLNLKNYFFSINGSVILILFFSFILKKVKINKGLLVVLLIIISFHLLNPSPNKNIIYIFDFFLKFFSSIILFQIFLSYKNKVVLIFFLLACIVQILNVGKNLIMYLKARPLTDNLEYSKNIIKTKSLFNKKNKLIIIDSDNDLLLYNHLNNGLINRKTYFTGYSDKSFDQLLNKKEKFYLIFDLFNNSFDLIEKEKTPTNNKPNDFIGRSFSKYLNNGDVITIKNKELKKITLKLLPFSHTELIVNNKLIIIKKDEIHNFDISPKDTIEIKLLENKKFVKLISLNKKNDNLNFPWGQEVKLEIFNNFYKQNILINFMNLNLNSKCKIIQINNDDYQDVYATGICE